MRVATAQDMYEREWLCLRRFTLLGITQFVCELVVSELFAGPSQRIARPWDTENASSGGRSRSTPRTGLSEV